MRELLFWILLAAVLVFVTGSEPLGVADYQPSSQLFACRERVACIRLDGYETVTAGLVSVVIRNLGVDAVICRAENCPKPANPIHGILEFMERRN